jgi:hypothetical protein
MELAMMRPVPLTLDEANTLVKHWHRHHRPLKQAKFCIGAALSDGYICGAAIVGRPVARLFDDGLSLEVNRLVTDGTSNACSMLYGAVARAAKALGYDKVWTYTRIDEPGTSLRAAGWCLDDPMVRARSWDMPGRRRIDQTEIVRRKRWLWRSGLEVIEPKFPALERYDSGTVDMFALERV